MMHWLRSISVLSASVLSAVILCCCTLGASAQDVEALDSIKPFTLNGSVMASLTGYSASGIDRRREPFSWMLTGSLVPTLYEIQFPLSFTFSNLDVAFRQPFNQFGISPSYKWITAHLGYRNMEFSRYTLSGVTFLGAGIELNPGPVRVAAMYGRFQRAVEEDTTQPFNLPAYERTGYALKVGFGSKEEFVDLSFLHAADDTLSLVSQPVDVSPAENSAFGLAAKVRIVPEILFEADAGASLFTRDLRSNRLDIDSSDIPSFLLDMQSPRTSTTLTFAGNAALSLVLTDFTLKLGYERIEPDFNSLGSYYVATDIENWTIAPTLRVMNGELLLAASIGIQRDNLLDTKQAQTDRLIGSGSVAWNPPGVFGLDASYINYSTGQSAGRTPINDTIRARNVTQSATIAPRLLLTNPEHNHFVTLVGSYQDFTDLSAFSNRQTDNSTASASLIYNITFVRSAITAGASLLYSDSRAGDFSTSLAGVTLNGSVMLLDNSLSLGGSVGYSRTSTRTDQLDLGNGSVLNQSVTASYRLGEEDNLGFTLNATQSNGVATSPSYDELTATLSYSRSFSIVSGE